VFVKVIMCLGWSVALIGALSGSKDHSPRIEKKRIFSRMGHIWTLLPLELEIFSGVRATLRGSLCTWEGYETTVTPEILPSSARKWISVMGPNGLKISARYLNALLDLCRYR